jgi:hypothetical protein
MLELVLFVPILFGVGYVLVWVACWLGEHDSDNEGL